MCSNPVNEVFNDIAVVEENTKGHDIVIGDVHGEITLLAHIVKDLKLSDRLFIAGDLVDRGEDSLGVLRFISNYNLNNPQSKIHIIKGNHEDLLLKYIETRLNPDKYNSAEISTIHDFYEETGGGWAFNLSIDECIELKKLIEPLPYIIHCNAATANDKSMVSRAASCAT